MKKIYSSLILLIMMMAVSSCEINDYDSELLGRWQLVAILDNGYEYEPTAREYEEYTFYRGGSGLYYNDFGVRVDFWWDQHGYDRVDIRYSDGAPTEHLYYGFSRGDLVLYDNYSRRTGRIFRYAGR